MPIGIFLLYLFYTYTNNTVADQDFLNTILDKLKEYFNLTLTLSCKEGESYYCLIGMMR